MSAMEEFLYETVGTRSKKSTRGLKRSFEGMQLSCHYCATELHQDNVTAEHLIPEIIMQAAYYEIEPVIVPSCWKCNNERSVIPGHVGMLFNSTDFRQIRSSARFLANLVRPVKKDKFINAGLEWCACEMIGAC